MENRKEVIVDLNAKNIDKLKALVSQQKIVEQMISDYITTILDTKEIGYTNANVKVSEDFTKIIINEATNEVVQ